MDSLKIQIKDLLSSANLKSDGEITYLDKGIVNPCFKVGNDWIVRFNQRDKNIPKFEREMIAYDLLRKIGLPVPEVTRLLEAKDKIKVMVSSLLPGKQIQESWINLSKKEKESICLKAGANLKRIGEIKLDRFGDLSPCEPKFDKWIDYLKYRLKKNFDECVVDGVFQEDELNDLYNLLDKNISAIGEVASPSLVHSDYHFGNILIDGDNISAIIDLEWSHGGDPLWELLKEEDIEEECPGAFDLFVKGYERSWPLVGNELIRLNIYKLIGTIEMIWVTKRYFIGKFDWGLVAHQNWTKNYKKLIEELS